ncbi:MAG: tetratricopeptide repeat protein [Candidatus Zixiibacteriota bacterium]
MYKGIAVIIILLVISAIGAASASELDSLLLQARQYYEDNDYDKALSIYNDVSARNYVSSSLYFNIGNCYFKKGELGYAILYYLRAQRLNPNDDDIKANLEFARQFMPNRLEGVKINPVTEFFDTVTAPFTLDLMAWLSSISFIILILLLSGLVYYQWCGLISKLTVYILIAVFVISAGLTTYKYRSEYLTKRGVIVAKEAKIYSAPTENSDVEFVGAFGLTFEVGRSVDNYYLVIFENKRKGWIRADLVDII